MKRMMMISMLAVLTAVPSVAQYVRRPYSRPVAPSYRSHYTTTPRHRSALDGYFGLRIGLGVGTVNADDRYLDGGSPKAGLNVGMVAGLQLAPATPLYLETGLSYIEKGGKGGPYDAYNYSLNYLEVPLLVKYQHVSIVRRASAATSRRPTSATPTAPSPTMPSGDSTADCASAVDYSSTTSMPSWVTTSVWPTSAATSSTKRTPAASSPTWA